MPHHLFSARFAIPVEDQAEGIATLQVSAIDAAGKVLRSQTLTTRSVYGSQRFSGALDGAASVQIT